MKNTEPLFLPQKLYEKWDIKEYYRITKTHIIALATKKGTDNCRILNMIPDQFFSEKLWKTLFRLPDKFLLLPVKTSLIEDIHILEFPFCTPLKQLVQTEPLSLFQIIQLISDLTDSLDSLHSAGILHMDISADNIFYNDDNRFILGDFSESCFLATISHSMNNHTTRIIAPECNTGPPTILSEQYSLGMLFYLLCNNGNDPPENLDDGIYLDLSALQTMPKVSDSLLSILSKMLAQTPADRYLDLALLRQDLAALDPQSLKNSSYQLFIPDETHTFHQKITPVSVNLSTKKHKSLLSGIPLLLLILTICIGMLSSKFSNSKSAKYNDNSFINNTNTHSTTGTALSVPSENSEITNHNKTVLDIANRNLSTLTAACSNETDLTGIHILLAENNQLSNVNDISSLSDLQEVYLSNNQLTDTEPFAGLSKLKILILSDNQCTDLSGLGKSDQLHFLDLSGNHELTNILELQNLTKLQTLILSDTSVSNDQIQKLQLSLPNCNIIY